MTKPPKGTRPVPLSLRLTPDERASLERSAAGQPLGTFIKARLFAGEPAQRGRRHHPVRDQRTIAHMLALLGQSELAVSLRDLADAARSGSLDCDDAVTAALTAGCGDIQSLRQMLVAALGLKTAAPPQRPVTFPRRAFSHASQEGDRS